ncbi:MAG: hemerythrin [Candidatus Omnitrophica bacterium CG11_big_fil_rev_8_21_14_0_20_42_13]|uniref:Hemerythrin n=1 Tax=Candidatus Ghiorseimicrobium undicola TaxID=1974746 RepID=A0A2H0LXY7_9BACT|nr:MAG: hemerythrin [Candidatus Omnitrophica bacterium CG11_big_fil_rev_8_21_14_0_20_42_13]
MTNKIQSLDLRPMPPFERHEKIFQAWDSLGSGDTLKITNDHDPKPLRYQFEVEYKDKYTWEYKQKGPKDWVVEIKKV